MAYGTFNQQFMPQAPRNDNIQPNTNIQRKSISNFRRKLYQKSAKKQAHAKTSLGPQRREDSLGNPRNRYNESIIKKVPKALNQTTVQNVPNDILNMSNAHAFDNNTQKSLSLNTRKQGEGAQDLKLNTTSNQTSVKPSTNPSLPITIIQTPHVNNINNYHNYNINNMTFNQEFEGLTHGLVSSAINTSLLSEGAQQLMMLGDNSLAAASSQIRMRRYKVSNNNYIEQQF